MMSAEKLVMAYKKNDHKEERITGSKDIQVTYWTDDESSGDDFIIKNNKLEANICKYIKNSKNVRRK